MITITLQSENGADARVELLNLLGVGVLVSNAQPAQIEELKVQMEIASTESLIEAALEPEKTKKRRTKAEIEAEKKTTEEEKQETEVKVPELADLQRRCAILVRAGYKEAGIKFIKEVGGAENSKEVPEEKRQAVIEAMEAFAADNKIAM